MTTTLVPPCRTCGGPTALDSTGRPFPRCSECESQRIEALRVARVDHHVTSTTTDRAGRFVVDCCRCDRTIRRSRPDPVVPLCPRCRQLDQFAKAERARAGRRAHLRRISSSTDPIV